ncbi:unnamed protein product [Mytilus coruscus]|uniref:Uncharacterized protein n=1 Tax=Mytilus coruscus TaxID=42192 RepID=A0A6J8CQG0_MYTCO|nr:unnamed protein product [Mytilus coruscus]
MKRRRWTSLLNKTQKICKRCECTTVDFVRRVGYKFYNGFAFVQQDSIDEGNQEIETLSRYKKGYDDLYLAFLDTAENEFTKKRKQPVISTKRANLINNIESAQKLEEQLQTVLNTAVEGKLQTVLNTAVEGKLQTVLNTAVECKLQTVLNTAVEGKLQTVLNTAVEGKLQTVLNTAVEGKLQTVLNTAVEGKLQTVLNTAVEGKLQTVLNTAVEGKLQTVLNTAVEGKLQTVLNTAVEGKLQIVLNTAVEGKLQTVLNTAVEEFDKFLEEHKDELQKIETGKEDVTEAELEIQEMDIEQADQELEAVQERFKNTVGDITNELQLLKHHSLTLQDQLQKLELSKPSHGRKELKILEPEGLTKGDSILSAGLGDEDEKNTEPDPFIPQEQVFSKYAAMVYTSSNNGKSFDTFKEAEFCPSCGEKTVICPHKLPGSEKVFKLPHSCTHIKISRPKVRVNKDIIEEIMKPVSPEYTIDMAPSSADTSGYQRRPVTDSATSRGSPSIMSSEAHMPHSLHRLFDDYKGQDKCRKKHSSNYCLLVKVVVYKNGLERAFLNFNGTGTNKTNWFSQERLQNSSFLDLKMARHGYGYFFSIKGSEVTKRRFYVNKSWGGCQLKDAGWLLVAEGQGFNCNYESRNKLMLLYSPNNTYMKNDEMFQGGYRANVLAIFVKFKSSTCQPLTHQTDICSTPVQLAYNTYCYKLCNKTNTETNLQEKIQKLEKELVVSKKDTKKHMRSLTSAPDNRYSSKTMGLVGTVCIGVVVGFLVAFDCVNICQKCSKANKVTTEK